jgi:hypothetical protein
VITRPGAVISGQVAEALLVTPALVQLSLPVAVTVLLTVHASTGAVKLVVKFEDAPGAMVPTFRTKVFGAGWLFTTVTLFKVTLPEFRTVPVYVIGPPLEAETAGQTSVTASAGVVSTLQVNTNGLITVVPLHTPFPVALRVVVTEQTLVGTVKLPVKLEDAPGVSIGAVKTNMPATGRSAVTMIFVRLIFPLLLTVPVYVNTPPAPTGVAGQTAVTAIWAVVRRGQVALAEFVTATPQALEAVAVKVSDTEQVLGAR